MSTKRKWNHVTVTGSDKLFVTSASSSLDQRGLIVVKIARVWWDLRYVLAKRKGVLNYNVITGSPAVGK